MIKSIAFNCGHTETGAGSGAVGLINESKENRVLGKKVMELLRKENIEVIDATIDKSISSSKYLQDAVIKANSKKVDLSVSLHFNCSSDANANGVEVLVFDGNSKARTEAKNICDRLSAIGFRNRGIKSRGDLYWLRATKSTSLLIEVCFVSSKKDVDLYKNNIDSIAVAIAESILGRKLSNQNQSNTTNKNMYRVIADGKHIGSYSVHENTLSQVKQLLEKGTKKIELEKI